MVSIAYIFSIAALTFVSGSFLFLTTYTIVLDGIPDHRNLETYEPPVLSRFYANDGSLIAEYAYEKRVFIPIDAIPNIVKHAFISAEDKNFYEHPGIDFEGIARAGYAFLSNIIMGKSRKIQGASTITQQVAKNFFLSPEQTYERKLKEFIIATRLEETFPKDKIFELYLNQIFLGLGSYGVGAASLLYFNKHIQELTVAEAAYLAALPKAPNNYHPIKHHDRAIARRNNIIRLMEGNGYINKDTADAAIKESLQITPPPLSNHAFAAGYFVEEVRRKLVTKYGENGLYRGGMSVSTTLDPRIQLIARQALINGLINYDMARGYRGPIGRLDLNSNWTAKLDSMKKLSDVPEWRLATVIKVNADSIIIGTPPENTITPTTDIIAQKLKQEPELGIIPAEHLTWAKKSKSLSLMRGDIIWVEKDTKKQHTASERATYKLRQIPEVSGAIMVMDPNTGRVLAVYGGFSFSESEFNRATQAWRQPGSAFKLFVYAAALDSGYTPSSVILDSPIEIQSGNTIWRPKNYDGKFIGPSTMRLGIEFSRNIMTVRLAQDMGLSTVVEYAKRFGVYDDVTAYLPMSIGANETTLMRMVAAYATIASGGKRFDPSFIERIQNRYGKTIYRHDQRVCISCNDNTWRGQTEPIIEEQAEQVLDPMTAYQITSMMEGVVKHGTGSRLRDLKWPVAGKTGSTNEEKDAWFIGFTPNIVVGVYMGYDKPRPMGRGSTGGVLAAPIVREALLHILEGTPPIPFKVPPNMQMFVINRRTGLLTDSSDPEAVVEAFKPGTSPPEDSFVIGSEEAVQTQPDDGLLEDYMIRNPSSMGNPRPGEIY